MNKIISRALSRPLPRGTRAGGANIPRNMRARMAADEARAWAHSTLAGALWESGERATRALRLAENYFSETRNNCCNGSNPAAISTRRQSGGTAPADPGIPLENTKMNAFEVKEQQSRQQLANCALLVAYVHGQPGGWYGISQGSADGFPCDYALVHSNPGDLECHPIRAFYLCGDESELQELETARQAVADNHDGELPLVSTLTAAEISAAVSAVREALAEDAPEDVEEWLIALCDGTSDLAFCNWDAVIEKLEAA